MVRIAIAEDDPSYRATLEDYLDRYRRENGLEAEVTTFSDGLALTEGYRPVYDLLLLDIEMPLLDGMTAAEKIRAVDEKVLIIFITNMAQYAIKGYQVDALDYVLKPVSYYAFAMKLKKALRILADRTGKQLLLSAGGNLQRLSSAELYYAEVADHQLHYHTAQGDFTATGTLRELERELAGEPFVRCNSCYLVNLAHVSGVKKDVAVVDGRELKISRPKRKEFLQALSDYYGGGGR